MTQHHQAAEQIFTGSSEMAELMRSHDWSKTPLGNVSSWTSSLKIAVSICLNSRFPMVIWWGKELVLLYNDAWRQILGVKHPKALGRPGQEIWTEIWDIIGVQLNGVLETAQATWSDDMLLLVDRYGYTEEAYFTYSYSPIFLQTGEVGGAFTAVTETTRRVIGERRLSTLRELASSAVEAKSVEETCRIASATLAKNPYDIPFALLYLVEQDGNQARLVGTVRVDAETSVSPERVDLTQEHDNYWKLAQVTRSGNIEIVDDLITQIGSLSGGVWDEASRKAIVIPIAQASQKQQVLATLILGISPQLAFDDEYRGFFDLVASNIKTAIANAQAYEEERQRAEALAELDRAKTVFFSNISHEFRTPLTLMLGPTEDALSDRAEPLPPAQQARIETVQRNGMRLLKLVNTLLDFSRIEAGRAQGTYEPTNLATYTAELASVFRSTIERANLRLVVDCPILSESVYVDREMWEKIVLNLLSNAFKFTLEGEISLQLRELENRVELKVQDTGIGIPATELPHLFKRFHRVKGAKGRSFEGSGIGLSLVQELVQLHHGTIEVTSVEGEGTCFTITIGKGNAHLSAEQLDTSKNLASTAKVTNFFVEEASRWLPEANTQFSNLSSELNSAAPLRTSSLKPESAQTARILLADDNADMRDYLKRLLSQRYEVEAVADGIAALNAIRRLSPDLVLSDVMMPGLDGFELLRSLRRDLKTQQIPIILLSARAGEEARLEGLEAGADDYLTKPFSARELLARVEATLKLAKLRQEAATREYALRAETEAVSVRLETVLAGINDQFIVFNRNWRITYLNDRAAVALGQPQEDLLNQNLWDLFPDLLGTEFHDRLHQAMYDRIATRFEYYYPTWDRWFENRLYPTPDGIVNLCSEITERKQLEAERSRLLAQEQTAREAAETANRIKDEFLAVLSHELRSPLNPILGWSKLLQNGNLDASKTKQGLETIERNARLQSELIEDLLDVSRILQGKLSLNVNRVNLAATIEAAIETVYLAAEAKSISVDVALDSRVGEVFGDATRLQQVVWNLLSNAVKFTAPGGHITVQLEQIGDQAQFRVSDNGKGIHPDFLPYVFDYFRQENSATTRKFGGLGLGLAIVRNLVELHGGTVWADSSGEELGSTFTVNLPLMPVQTSVTPDLQSSEPSLNLNGRQILVIDDETDSREFVAFVLELSGAKVTTATTAKEGLANLTQCQPDILLSDIGMPDMDGYMLMRQIRALPPQQGGNVLAIALTAYAGDFNQQQALQAGFQQHLSKPIEPDALVRAISTLLTLKKPLS
ncbi:MAG TPA: ATP-binding protein [Coleofasciculaceae cyanobacterium]|jgi:PAS domain S-box-containing protein